MRSIDRFKGCLLGGAVGDALGYAVEFQDLDQIRKQYGPEGITSYDLNNKDHKALISDDTQMTLFTATALLFGETRGRLRGIGEGSAGYFRLAYRDWLRTQIEDYPIGSEVVRTSWLINCPELYASREPGRTCISSLLHDACGIVEEPANNSKGCGGIMRTAPIGIYYIDKDYYTVEDADRIAAGAAAVTHGHELGYIPAAALAHIIYLLASGQETELLPAVRDAMESMRKLFPEAVHMNEFHDVMEKAIALAQEDLPDADAIHQIGGGWVAEETLAVAVYCALKYPQDFERAIIASVNHNGDSDSTGAVTGNILGAKLGAGAIPDCFLCDLELRDIIEEIAEDLYQDCQFDDEWDDIDPVWESKYIRMDYEPDIR